MTQPCWKKSWQYLGKLHMYLPFDPAIPLLGIYPKDMLAKIQKDIYTKLFIAALLVIPRLETAQCPSIRNWMNNLWFIHPVLYSCKKE